MSDLLNSISHLLFRVENGTGVVVSPASVNYSYILTAKHNLELDDDENSYLQASDINATSLDGTSAKVADLILHPTLDLAILVTEERFESGLLISKDLKNEARVCIAGFPQVRGDQSGQDQLRDFPGKVARTTRDFLSIALDEVPDHGQVAGVSGGGLFKEREGEFILCGIQACMEGDVAREHHGRVRCIPLDHVEQMLRSELNKKGYSLIYPEHLSCFSKLQPNIFPFGTVQTPSSVQFLRGVLQSIATDLRTNSLPKPQEIYEKYNSLLLVNNTPGEDVFHPELWTTYLEFLVVASIIDQTTQVDFSYLERDQSKRRFLFSATSDNWTSLLKDIYTSDLRGLSKDGVIIVSTRDKASTQHALTSLTLKGVIADIGRMQPGTMRIDHPMKNPALEFKLYHWSGLHHRCVISKEDDYSQFYAGSPDGELEELIEKLRQEYNAFI